MAEAPPITPQPTGAPVPPVPKEPEIHVIPAQFYGIAGKAKLPPPKPSAPGRQPPAAPGTAPLPGAPAVPGAPAAPPPPSGSKTWIIIPVIAVVILAGLGVAAWYLLRRPAPRPPAAPAQPAITLPPVEEPPTQPEPPPTEPEPPPPPVPEPELPEPEESATTTEDATGTPPVPPPPPPQAAADSDNDQVSDREEALYGTNPNGTDSDGDGFRDDVELVNLYNPAGFRPTRLVDAGLVSSFRSPEARFEILYPSAWLKVDQPGGEVRFDNDDDQPIAVSVEENPERQPILDWYLSRNPQVSPLEARPFTTKQGHEAVRSSDGFTAYVSAGGRVYIIAYAPGLQENAHYRSTLTMMVNSFTHRP